MYSAFLLTSIFLSVFGKPSVLSFPTGVYKTSTVLSLRVECEQRCLGNRRVLLNTHCEFQRCQTNCNTDLLQGTMHKTSINFCGITCQTHHTIMRNAVVGDCALILATWGSNVHPMHDIRAFWYFALSEMRLPREGFEPVPSSLAAQRQRHYATMAGTTQNAYSQHAIKLVIIRLKEDFLEFDLPQEALSIAIKIRRLAIRKYRVHHKLGHMVCT